MNITEGKKISLPGVPAHIQAFEGDDWIALYDGERHVCAAKPMRADLVEVALGQLRRAQ